MLYWTLALGGLVAFCPWMHLVGKARRSKGVRPSARAAEGDEDKKLTIVM